MHAVVVLFVLVSLVSVPPATIQAVSTGITGNSGKQGANCADCHSDGTAPLVRLEGPDAVYAGALATFRFVVRSQTPRQQLAGFNVAADGGQLEPFRGTGARLEVDELTHDQPKATVADETTWLFTWRAPQRAGDQTLYAAGLSVNGNGTRSGDEMMLLEHVVAVWDGPRPGDANCDGALSAADLSEVVRLSSGGVVEDCDLADADCDGSIDGRDIVVLIAGLFDSPTTTWCVAPAAD